MAALFGKASQQVQTESVERDQLLSEASWRGRVRDQAVSVVGLAASQVEDGTELTDGSQTSPVDAWETQLKALLEEPLEVALEPYPWQEDFNRWARSGLASCPSAGRPPRRTLRPNLQI